MKIFKKDKVQTTKATTLEELHSKMDNLALDIQVFIDTKEKEVEKHHTTADYHLGMAEGKQKEITVAENFLHTLKRD